MKDSDGGEERRRRVDGLVRSAFVMTLMTSLSRVLGLVREQVRSNLLGTGAGSDAFGLAALLPNLLRRLFAEGATTAAFVPVFTETKERSGRAELWLFASRFLSLLTLVTTAVSLGGVLLAPWIVNTFFGEGFAEVEGKVELTIVLTQIMFPYLALISVAAIIQGILNSFGHFGPSAFTPVLLNLAIIGCAVLLRDLFPDPSYAFAVGFILGGTIQLGFQIPFLIRIGGRIKPTLRVCSPRVREVLKIMGPGVFAAGIYQINVFVSQMLASRLQEGSVASLQYSLRLQELVLGVFVVSLSTVILPTLSRHVARGERDEARDTLVFVLGLLTLVTLPATVGLIVLGAPIVRLLFEHGEFSAHSTRLTTLVLLFHALALYPVAVGRVGQQAFFAMKNQRTPMRVGALSMVVNVTLCLMLPGLFAPERAHGGIAAAGAIAATTNAAVLLLLLRGKLGAIAGRALIISLLRVGLAAVAMGAIMWGLREAWGLELDQGRLVLALKLVVVGGAGVLAFLAAAAALRSPELSELKALIRRRL